MFSRSSTDTDSEMQGRPKWMHLGQEARRFQSANIHGHALRKKKSVHLSATRKNDSHFRHQQRIHGLATALQLGLVFLHRFALDFACLCIWKNVQATLSLMSWRGHCACLPGELCCQRPVLFRTWPAALPCARPDPPVLCADFGLDRCIFKMKIVVSKNKPSRSPDYSGTAP